MTERAKLSRMFLELGSHSDISRCFEIFAQG